MVTKKKLLSNIDELKKRIDMVECDHPIHETIHIKYGDQHAFRKMCHKCGKTLETFQTELAFLESWKLWLVSRICSYESKIRDLDLEIDNKKNRETAIQNDFEIACREFLKGCSNTEYTNQEYCEECLTAFCDKIRTLSGRQS